MAYIQGLFLMLMLIRKCPHPRGGKFILPPTKNGRSCSKKILRERQHWAALCVTVKTAKRSILSRESCSGVSISNDFQIIKEKAHINVDDVIVEYIDKIERNNEKVYTSSLILCNSDYSISLIMPFEITPKNILNQM